MRKPVVVEQVLEAWTLATAIHSSWGGGAAEEEVAEAERRLGRTFHTT